MAGERHRITSAASDHPLVVAGPKGEQVILDDLDAQTARHWHHRLSEQHEPHSWQTTDGGRTGWNSVAGYFVASDMAVA